MNRRGLPEELSSISSDQRPARARISFSWTCESSDAATQASAKEPRSASELQLALPLSQKRTFLPARASA